MAQELFVVDDMLRLRTYIGLFGSLLSFTILVITIVIYSCHPTYRVVLRENFNTMTIFACAWHLFVASSRVVSCSALLTGRMTSTLCEVTGAINVGADSAGLVMILGFYCCLLTLRLSFLRRAYRCVVPSSWRESFGVCFTLFMSAGLGVTSAVMTIWSEKTMPDTGTPFGVALGWCAGGVNPDLFVFSHGVSLGLLALTSVGCFIALRCDGCLGLRIRQPVSCLQHWPLFVRFFGVVGIVIALYTLLFFVHSVGTKVPHYLTVCTVFASLWSSSIALLFLWTEGILHLALLRLQRRLSACCARDQKVDTTLLVHDMEVTDPHFADAEAAEDETNVTTKSDKAKMDYVAIRGGGFTSIMRTLMSIEMRSQVSQSWNGESASSMKT